VVLFKIFLLRPILNLRKMGRFSGFEGHFGCLQKKLFIIFFIKTLSERYPNVRYNVIITPFGALVHLSRASDLA